MSNQTFYRVSNLDGRLDNPDHCLTDDISAFSTACAHLYSHVSKPLLDVITISTSLVQLAAAQEANTTAGPLLGGLVILVTGRILRLVSPSFGVLVAEEAARTINARQEAEAHIFWARFAAMECGTSMATEDEGDADVSDHLERLRDKAITHLDTAEAICKRFTASEPDPTSGLSDELAEVRRMLDNGISSSEMRMVVAAMAKEFRGTGH